MVGILITSHGNLCKEILASAEMIARKQMDVKTVVLDETGIEKFSQEIEAKLEECICTYDEVVILADIANATPYNNCYKFWLKNPEARLYLLSGYILLWLLELLIMRNYNADGEELVKKILATGKNGVELASLTV